MMEDDNGTIRNVAWRELCPWLSIFRVFRMSIALPALAFATLGILLTAIGWGVLGMVFGTDTPGTAWLNSYAECPWKAITDCVPNEPMRAELPGEASTFTAITSHPSTVTTVTEVAVAGVPGEETIRVSVAPQPVEPFFGSWAILNQPIRQGLLDAGLTVRGLACLVLCGLWGITLWAFFGAAITRMASVQLATGERIGMAAAMRHAAAKWPSYFLAPLWPLFGVLLAVIPVFCVGLLLRFGLGALFAGFFLWPLVLVAGLVMAVLLVGLLFGWPLMWGTISTERSDCFDAISRAYAYTFQRPLHYLFYAAVAAVIGGLGWILVRNFAAGVIWMGYWAAAWGCGSQRIASILGTGEPLSGMTHGGTVMIHFWAGCVKLLAVGYLFSYFWTASSAIYFLLRRDVDSTAMDEVVLDADASEQAAALPPIGTDEAGAPVVGERAAQSAEGAGAKQRADVATDLDSEAE